MKLFTMFSKVTAFTSSKANLASRLLQRTSPAVVLTGLFLATGCVSQQQYDDQVVVTKRAQQQLFERDQAIEKLQKENNDLKRGVAMNEVSGLSNAGYGDDLDTRLSELRAKIDNLDHPMQDIERFSVDGGYVLMVQDKILFDSGSADVNADGKKALAKIAGEIDEKPHGRIWVRGHTDSDKVSKPSTKEKFPHGNLQLSAARAIEVASELVTSGKVPARDVAVVGFGQYDPITKNDTADNKRLNRRVEIFVSDKSAGATPASSAKQ
jgi:flagellar motor protein MotB